MPVKDKEGCSKCTSCKLFYLFLADIGNPPQHLPIIDGGEGTPKLVIIGQDFTPPTEDLKGKTILTVISCCHDNSQKCMIRAWFTVYHVITTHHNSIVVLWWFSPDVIAAMFVYRTKAGAYFNNSNRLLTKEKKVFGNLTLFLYKT